MAADLSVKFKFYYKCDNADISKCIDITSKVVLDTGSDAFTQASVAASSGSQAKTIRARYAEANIDYRIVVVALMSWFLFR